MAVVIWHEDGVLWNKRKIMWVGSFNAFVNLDTKAVASRRPSINGEEYPAVYACIDGQDYMILNAKPIKRSDNK